MQRDVNPVQAEIQKSPKRDVIAAPAQIQNGLIELVSRFVGMTQ